jgi:hypothetical protein
MDLGDLALLHVEPGHPARLGRGDLHQRLVGHHLDHRLVLLDHVALG